MKVQAVIGRDERIEIIGSEPDKSIKIVDYERFTFTDGTYEYWTVECNISVTIENILLFDKYNKVYYAGSAMEGRCKEGYVVKAVDCWIPLEKGVDNE